MTYNLAIIIPAYKAEFLKHTLDSIANQTCRLFTLYVGDDSGDSNIGSIVEQYKEKIPIIYRRFANNVGKTDLIAHWERCIDMTREEEWIWFFSDDDEMDQDCVALFLKELEKKQQYDLYHFNVTVIDAESEPITTPKNDYPEVIDFFSYYKKRVKDELISFSVEFIFRKKKFFDIGRFQNFDLAWGSDVATWVKISYEKGICTIPQCRVSWRKSEKNISPDNTGQYALRKANALIDFLAWSEKFFYAKGKNVRSLNRALFLKRLKGFLPYLSNKEIEEILENYVTTVGDLRLPCFLLKWRLWYHQRLFFAKIKLKFFFNRSK